ISDGHSLYSVIFEVEGGREGEILYLVTLVVLCDVVQTSLRSSAASGAITNGFTRASGGVAPISFGAERRRLRRRRLYIYRVMQAADRVGNGMPLTGRRAPCQALQAAL